MDFWSRLIAGTSLSPAAANKAAANNPEKRLARFKREYNQLLQIWRGSSNLSQDLDAAEDVRSSLQDLTAILGDESRRPLPHPCITFSASKQIYIPIGKIAATSYNEGIIREGVAFFATLIDSEEEDFVENDGFSTSLMSLLVKITGVNSIRLGQETEVEIVELSFNITTKIRLDPEILPVWFTAQPREELPEEDEDAHERFAGKTQKEDFPLFYLLIDYIHDEGRIGDFARTGLLYIIEAASNSVSLEQWIVESDLATIMATGLGALYSQLSRKLVIDYLPHELPPILALSDYEHPVTTTEIVSSADAGFQAHMDTFLSHLVFWQDVLNHCKSIEVKQTLLEHFQVIFLQQLLYPSLLESSDADGGSSVAVLTYLRQILESLDHPDMIHLILHYLLALPETKLTATGSQTSVSAARKRKSMDLATIMASQMEASTTPALFNLVDLIQGSLKSVNQQTILVTLRLVSVILRRHHRYGIATLLWTSHIVSEEPQRTIGAHEKEMDFLLTLARDIGNDEDIDDVYEDHVKDCMGVLESHPCSLSLIAPKTIGTLSKVPGAQGTIPRAPRDIRAHTLRPEDPMLQTFVSILSTFFINSIETNLALTGTIIDLAACGFMRIDGWLVPDPSHYRFKDDKELGGSNTSEIDVLTESVDAIENYQIQALRNSRRIPDWDEKHVPAILVQLKALVNDVSAYRDQIPRFDDLLQHRRNAFKASSAAIDTSVPIQQSSPLEENSLSRSSSPPRPSALDSLAQRIFDKIDTPSRSGSPRGRRSQETQRNISSGTSNTAASVGHGISTPIRSIQPPPQFPMGFETPSRESSRAFSSSPMRAQLGHREVPESQIAAFAAVDQSILSRKVGLQTIKGDFIRIPFPDLKSGDSTVGPNDRDLEDNEHGSENDGDIDSEPTKGKGQEDPGEESILVTVSHVLTNVLVLQEFLLELAALVQVRAGLFGEIKFS